MRLGTDAHVALGMNGKNSIHAPTFHQQVNISICEILLWTEYLEN